MPGVEELLAGLYRILGLLLVHHRLTLAVLGCAPCKADPRHPTRTWADLVYADGRSLQTGEYEGYHMEKCDIQTLRNVMIETGHREHRYC